VWALYELLIERGVKVALILDRLIECLRVIEVLDFRCSILVWTIILH